MALATLQEVLSSIPSSNHVAAHDHLQRDLMPSAGTQVYKQIEHSYNQSLKKKAFYGLQRWAGLSGSEPNDPHSNGVGSSVCDILTKCRLFIHSLKQCREALLHKI